MQIVECKILRSEFYTLHLIGGAGGSCNLTLPD
jgi:hypothetical protein